MVAGAPPGHVALCLKRLSHNPLQLINAERVVAKDGSPSVNRHTASAASTALPYIHQVLIEVRTSLKFTMSAGGKYPFTMRFTVVNSG
jgi:hypothetical protein